MSGAELFDYWSHTLLVTAALVIAVLVVRKPFARHFGPRLTYALWLIPGLRLILPPLPFGNPVAPVAPVVLLPGSVGDASMMMPIDAAPAAAVPVSLLPDLEPLLFSAWTAGMFLVLVAAFASHRRFRREVLAGAVALESIGSTRLVMSDTIDGPVAFGLLRRYVAVPQDFFARYDSEERSLAMSHELSHHRHGDLWANAAALILLSAQWFNPFAWAALRAFRFDQESACDARVLTMSCEAERVSRTAHYAATIAKAAVGPRLILAAPMAAHDNLQERLTMLTKQDISKGRGMIGRLLLGGAAVAALVTTATLVPAQLASAADQASDIPAPPPPPAPPRAPDAPEAPDAPPVPAAPEAPMPPAVPHEAHRVMVISDQRSDGPHVHPHNADHPVIREVEIRRSVEKAVEKAEKAAEKHEAAAAAHEARVEAMRSAGQAMAEANAAKTHALAFAMANCAKGAKPKALVDRREEKDGSASTVKMFRCGGKDMVLTAQIQGLKKVREIFASGQANPHFTAEMRAKAAADIDKAIAELERHGT